MGERGCETDATTAAASADRATAGEAEWQVVDRTLRHLARRRAALDVEEATWLRRARSAGVHRHLGYGSFTEYVERVLGYAPGPARERLRVADALTVLPKLRAALYASSRASPPPTPRPRGSRRPPTTPCATSRRWSAAGTAAITRTTRPTPRRASTRSGSS